MIKKITFFALGLLLTAGLCAQVGNNEMYGHATKSGAKAIAFSASNIQFWTGTGTNQAVVIVGWDDNTAGTNFALAWGVRWTGTATAQNMLDTIMAYDSRFSYSISSSFVNNVSYNDGTLVSGSSNSYWCYNVNNVMASTYPTQIMANGDVMEISSSCNFTLSSASAATDPNASGEVVSDTITASEINYWVGEGPFEIVFVVNWPDTALAWGYRFSARSTNLQSVMTALAEADPRLSFEYGTYGLDDILFVENGDTLRKAAFSWWEHSLNGSLSSGLGQQLNAGDFSRWADPTAGVLVDSTYDSTWNYWMYSYAYPQTIYPVSNPVITDATISTADLIYWVGEGSNELTFVVNWADTALAWGYRFSTDSVTLATVMDDIAAADPRFSYSGEGMVNDINFVENGNTLGITPGNWWSHLLNGYTSAGMGQWMHNGDFSRWADPAAGVLVDSIYHSDWNWWEYIYAYPQTIYPVSNPTPQDATISADDIRYWVGEGSNQLIFVVNWPSTALAWGYRFDGNATVQDAMDAIAAADSRFSYETGDWGVDDILFIENGDTLRKAEYSWWEHTMNGVMSAGMYQPLSDGDFSRWADPTAGVVVDSIYDSDWDYWMYTYAYPQAIIPVSDPNVPDVGPFCGAVGTEGCTAVKFDDSRIRGWATGCTVVRGSSNLLDPNAAPVTFGSEADAVGPATTSTTDVVSLGDGGSATLTFATPIVNGDGYDFAVFENPFNDRFLELGVVEVSTDGEHFVRFPATSLTQTDYQITDQMGVDPTFINNLAGKYRVGYGTPFDLEELRDSANIDINNINYVRVIDVVGSIDPQYGTYDAFGHLINDPFPTITYSAGFDLDGVAVLNNTLGINTAESVALQLYPNPASSTIWCQLPDGQGTLVIYNASGKEMMRHTLTSARQSVRIETLPNGVYFVSVTTPQGTQTSKLIIRH